MKRVFDICASMAGMLVAAPVLLPVMFLTWFQDFHHPFYIAQRIGLNRKTFRMFKLRSMIISADKSGVFSTSNDDQRITKVGHFLRKYKLDEVSQLINVFFGTMSLVGPRPNVESDVSLYTTEEKRLLSIKPGITDFSSIIFSDEGDILAGSENPDLRYNQVIRPWKSRLGLVYVDHSSLWLDLQLIYLTVVAIFAKPQAIRGVVSLLQKLEIEENIIEVCRRQGELIPHPPPGMKSIVQDLKA